MRRSTLVLDVVGLIQSVNEQGTTEKKKANGSDVNDEEEVEALLKNRRKLSNLR